MNINAIANELLKLLGGKDNIASAAHCATRLRLVLVDDSLVNKSAIEKVDGVKGCFSNAGQIQIIFGTGLVNKVHAEFINPKRLISRHKNSILSSVSPAFCRTSLCRLFRPLLLRAS
jgi:phosphotransferase system IIB component